MAKDIANRKEPEAPAEPAPALSDMAHKALMDMITSGELAPNEVVTERQIALKLGISRTPMREAIRRLEGERLLERQRSGALVVRALPVEEYLSIVAVRRLVEGESARLAAGRVPQVELDRLRERIVEMMKLPDDTVTPEAAASDRDLHGLIATCSGNPVLEQVIGDLRKRTSMFRYGRMPTRRRDVGAEHLAIIDALLAGDGERARQAMHAHIDQVRLTVLARLGGH